MATLQPDLTIGCYKLIRLLGEGGMGEVWKALDLPADRMVALKFIRPELLNNAQVRTRFTNEAKTLGKLEQDRIVPLYAVVEEGERLAFVLRYIEGQSLADRIQSQSPLPASFILSSARDVLPALGYAHQQGVIHRDVKPQNILVNHQDQCFLTDFGIAVAGFLERATVGSFAIGTPHYMSPEQIIRPSEVTIANKGQRSDIYSYGVVLFEMLTGQVPFGQNSKPEEIFTVQQAHCQTPPPPLRALNGAISPAMEAVVLRCLEKDPDHRQQSCAELLAEIEEAVHSPEATRITTGSRARSATIIEPVSSQLLAPHSTTQLVDIPRIPDLPPKRKTGRMLAIAAALLAVAVVTAGVIRGSFTHSSVRTHSPTPQSTPLTAATTPGNATAENTKPNKTTQPSLQNTSGHNVPPNHNSVPGPNQLPPSNTPPNPNDAKASALANQAAGQYQNGDYCVALATLNEAIDLSNNPAYSRLKPGYMNACNHEQTN